MSDKKKGKIEPKEQRKARQKQVTGKINENCSEKPVQKASIKPEYIEPGPEFYKNLKRETDEIIKITQESNAKYSKKEIQSNWTKYDIPILSYENIDQEESIGEDYEKIVQMAMSTGGHFQFKHEKSWNIVTTPSEFNKYFEVDPENFALSLSSIPFYERNDLNIDLFTEYDLNNIKNRASKYKEKYENSKILDHNRPYKDPGTVSSITVLEDKEIDKEMINVQTNKEEDSEMLINTVPDVNFELTDNKIDETNLNKNHNNENNEIEVDSKNNAILTDIEVLDEKIKTTHINQDSSADIEVSEVKAESSVAPTNKPHLKSPEDLEKWLDDFLDG